MYRLFIFFSLYTFSSFADVSRYTQFTQSVSADDVQTILEEHRLEWGEKLTAEELIQYVKKEERKQFSDEILQKLYDYRIEIQENAYETTMKLCPAYRIAKGMGLPEYHKKLSDSYYVSHESPKMRNWALNMNEEYGEVLSSSLQSWLYVMYEGGVQPFSAIGGIKADFIEKLNISFFDWKSWFYSFYTLYLTDSLGFLQAAMHCLNTMSSDEINQFAVTVLFTDAVMSTAGYALTFWAGDKILRAIIQGIRWSSRPISRMITRFLHKNNISPDTVKKYALLAGFVGVGTAAGWIVQTIKESQKEQDMFQEMMQKELERAKNKSLPLKE